MRRLLIAGLAAVVVIVLGVAALPWLLPTGFAVTALAEAVRQATGRTLTVNGGITASLWSNPGVTLRDVVISNPPGGQPGQVATIDELRLSLSPGAIFARRMEPTALDVIRPRISLITSGGGEPNFLPPEGAAGATPAYPLRIEDADIRYLDERTGATLQVTEANLRLTPPAEGTPAGVEGYLTWNGQRVALSMEVKSPQRLAADGSPVDIAIDAGPLKASFSGRASLAHGLSLAGTGEAESPSLRELLRWIGFQTGGGIGLGALKATAAVDSRGAEVKLADLVLSLDGMNAKGRATLDLAGPRAKLDAALGLDRIDADAYVPRGPVSDDWSDAPLSFAGLKALDATLDLVAGGLVFRDLSLGKLTGKVRLDGGKLAADISGAELWGGTARGTVTIDGSGPAPSVAVDVEAKEIDAAQAFATLTGSAAMRGRGEAALTIAAAGRSQRELVAMLNGAAWFSFTGGAIQGVDLAAMARQATGGIVTGWSRAEGSGPGTPFSALRGGFAIADGLAATKDLTLEAPTVSAQAQGIVDLLRRSLDLKAAVTLPPPAGATVPATPPAVILLKGPWVEPKAFADVPAAPAAPQGAAPETPVPPPAPAASAPQGSSTPPAP
jgi:AsmA protein